MNRFKLLLLLCVVSFGMQAQTPKLRVESRLFGQKYELGDKSTSSNDVALHLKKYETDAYIKWRSADKAGVSALVWSIIGLGGVLVGVFSEESSNQILGYGVGVLGTSVSIGASYVSKARRQKAIDIYNTKYGY